MNPDGKDGPTLISIFSCKDCKYLGKPVIGAYGGFPYKCYHDDMIRDKSSPYLMTGNIGEDKITPSFCPFLLKKTRYEKLNELQNYENC